MSFHQGGALPLPGGGKDYLLYLHFPFCEGLCTYCSFHRIEFEPSLAVAYMGALKREILLYRDLGYRFDSVYVGGGTPTILPGPLASTLGLIRSIWPIRQISLETNPNHLTPQILSRLGEMGINRLSVGVQTFNDRLLERMGRRSRYGSGEWIRQRLIKTRGHFDTLNIDMMFNLPGQSEGMLLNDLSILRELGVDQITYYPLMSAEGGFLPPIRDWRRERIFYRWIRQVLAEGYFPSTAWCFARKGAMIDEYIVEHDEYAGLGSGAFGYLQGTIYANTFSIPRYIDSLNRGRPAVELSRSFSLAEQIRYDLLMKLFGQSLCLGALKEKYGPGVLRYLWKELFFLRAVGAIVYRGPTIYLTPRGQYYWLILMKHFFQGVNAFRAQSRAVIDLYNYDKVPARFAG